MSLINALLGWNKLVVMMPNCAPKSKNVGQSSRRRRISFAAALNVAAAQLAQDQPPALLGQKIGRYQSRFGSVSPSTRVIILLVPKGVEYITVASY